MKTFLKNTVGRINSIRYQSYYITAVLRQDGIGARIGTDHWDRLEHPGNTLVCGHWIYNEGSTEEQRGSDDLFNY